MPERVNDLPQSSLFVDYVHFDTSARQVDIGWRWSGILFFIKRLVLFGDLFVLIVRLAV